MSLQILVPCKSLRGGKSRLAPVLDEEERHTLSAFLLEKTLALATSLVPASRCHVVSGDSEVVYKAIRFGVMTIVDPGSGLNDALQAGRKHIGARASQFDLLVLPIDLPMATLELLTALTQLKADVAIAPDRDLDGTNALYLNRHAAPKFKFKFGKRSFAAHHEAAKARGFNVAVFSNTELAFDLDLPEHLTGLRKAGCPGLPMPKANNPRRLPGIFASAFR